MSPNASGDPQRRAYAIDQDLLRNMDVNDQIEVMRDWFQERYESVTENCPYDSEDDEYFCPNGGPFYPRDILSAEFGDIVDEAAIDTLARSLEDHDLWWTLTDAHSPYRDDLYEIEAALDDGTPIRTLHNNLDKIRQLFEQSHDLDLALRSFQLMLIYSAAVTSLEAYLSDVFAKKVLSDDALKERFLRTELADQKIGLGELFKVHREIDTRIKQKLVNTSFHALPKVKRLYDQVLGIDLGEVAALELRVKKRHDFVHRGGRDIDGNEVATTLEEVQAFIQEIEAFCVLIDAKMDFSSLDDRIPF